MTWLPYISTDGKVWWFNERCSLFCWDDDKADIYYSAMEINEPRYVAQLQQAAAELGMGRAGLTDPMQVPVYVNPEPTLLDNLRGLTQAPLDIARWRANWGPTMTQQALASVVSACNRLHYQGVATTFTQQQQRVDTTIPATASQSGDLLTQMRRGMEARHQEMLARQQLGRRPGP